MSLDSEDTVSLAWLAPGHRDPFRARSCAVAHCTAHTRSRGSVYCHPHARTDALQGRPTPVLDLRTRLLADADALDLLHILASLPVARGEAA